MQLEVGFMTRVLPAHRGAIILCVYPCAAVDHGSGDSAGDHRCEGGDTPWSPPPPPNPPTHTHIHRAPTPV